MTHAETHTTRSNMRLRGRSAGVLAMVIAGGLGLLAPVSAAHADPAIDLDWYVIAPAGETSSNGLITLEGTIGQAGAGLNAASADLPVQCPDVVQFSSGYWHELKAACPGDFNRDGVVEIADIFFFLSAWFNLDPRANYTCDGPVDIPDVFAFLSYWFAGCG